MTRSLRTLCRLGLLATLSAAPSVAFADGGADISAFFVTMIAAFWPLWMIVATLVIIIAGFTLLVSSDENALSKARSTITAVVIGGIIITIIWTLGPLGAVGILYNGVAGFGVINNSYVLGFEAEGVAGWLTTMTAMAGILMIIVTMVKAVASFTGDEGSFTNVRMSILHVICGLMTIAAAYILRRVVFPPLTPTGVPLVLPDGTLGVGTPSPLMNFIAGRILVVLSFILLIAVAILIYAGLRMITSYGREDEYTAAKALAVRVLAGIVVILVSFSIVWFVVAMFNGWGT